jgi:Uncharacterized membrane protein, required for N-linked glycosylation
MISIVPGYISRSVAGSYDNEAIAIFCMLLTYYSWIKAVKTGSILWSALTALAYFYMVSFIVSFLLSCPPLRFRNDKTSFVTVPSVKRRYLGIR